MQEHKAQRVVAALRALGVPAEHKRAGVYQFGVAVALSGGREAVWDTDGSAGLEAQVMANGMLVGYVPRIVGSEDFDEAQVVEAIRGTDYDRPVATRATGPVPPAAPLPVQGGVFQRIVEGFRGR